MARTNTRVIRPRVAVRTTQTMTLRHGQCCALTEISGISYMTPREVLEALHTRQRDPRIVIFTGASSRKDPAAYAIKFKEFIESRELGVVHFFPPHQNRTTSWVTVYMWYVSPSALADYHELPADKRGSLRKF